MEMYYKLIDMLEKELKQFSSRNEISSNSLEMIDSITHSIKSMETICAMRGASETGYSGAYEGSSHARGGRNRDSMGRFRNGYSGTYDNGGYMGGYSRTGSDEDYIRELEQMKMNAPEQMKHKFQAMIDEMRSKY